MADLPSLSTSHHTLYQFPVAFIIKASGLDKHGMHSKQPLVRNCPRQRIARSNSTHTTTTTNATTTTNQAFSQLDIAGGAVENMDMRFGNPTATPLVALTARYVLQ